MLKDNGNSKKHTIIKCDKCRERFNLEDIEIIKLGDLKYYECPYCGQQQILKK